MVKPWLSKTFWMSTVSVILAIINYFTGGSIDASLTASILAIIYAFIRTQTNEPLEW